MVLLLDGKKIMNEIASELQTQIKARANNASVKPCLAIVQVGDNKESEAYIKNKKKFGQHVGAEVRHVHLSASVIDEDVLSEIDKLNADKNVHGIIVQMPLPQSLDKDRIIESIAPEKDVDGLTAASIKGLWIANPNTFMPATTRGVLTMLKHYGVEIGGKHVVVIGRSALVGRPTAIAFLNENATVTICHTGTKDLEYHTLGADIIITAVGRPRLLTEYHVKANQIIVDVGITIEEAPELTAKHRPVGDVDFEAVSRIVTAISPVPGGVGPLTVASLFQNLFDAYSKNI